MRSGVALWLWLAFSWWWMLQGVFSCAYLTSTWWSVCSDLLPYFGFFPLCFEDLLCILETSQKCDVQLLPWTFFCKPLNFWKKDRMKFVLLWARQKVFTYNTKSIIQKIKTDNLGSVESKPFWRVFLVLAWLRWFWLQIGLEAFRSLLSYDRGCILNWYYFFP